MTFQELAIVAPFVAAILTAIAILLVDLAWPGRSALAVATALIGLAITAWLVILVGGSGTQLAFGGTYEVDALTTFLQLLLIGVVALSIVFGPDYLAPRNLPIAEFATVLVFALTGAMLIAASADLLILFLAPRADGAARLPAGGLRTRPTPTRPRARSSTSCSARSARRSSCSASRSCGA